MNDTHTSFVLPRANETSARLLAFARPYWKEISLSLLLSVATTAASIGLMGTSAFLIATAALQPSIAVLQVAIVGVRAFGISRGVFRYLERLVSHSVNFRLLASLRGWFFRSVEPLVPGGVEDIKSGDLLGRSIQDIETLEDFYVRGIAPPLSAAIITVGIGLFTLRYSVSLAAVLVSGLILTGLVLSFQVSVLSRSRSNDVIQSRAKVSAMCLETLNGASEIIMANAQDTHLSRLRLAGRQARSANLAAASLHSAALSSGVLISNLTLLGMLCCGIPLVRTGQIDGVILSILSLITLASFEPVNLLPATSSKIETSLAAARHLFAISDRPIPVKEPHRPAEITEFIELRLDNLSFSYPRAISPTINEVSLSLQPGKKIALVGPSGSGKSTLLKIIQHHLPVSPGMVFWNGVDANELTGQTARNLLAVLSQNGYIFSASLKENLTLANADEQAHIQALKQTGLAEWFDTLPAGMDSWLGDNGSLLSGGERQRLLVARTLLLQRPIFLADEPFTNLDITSEHSILREILKVSSKNACVVATHRLVGMELFDEILVLDAGRIVQRGNHTDLIKQRGLYIQFWEQQNNLFFFDE